MSPTQGGPDLFVGVDGGATKTLLRIEDAKGRVLGHGRGGAANIRLSVAESWRSIQEALAEALSQAGLSLDDVAGRLHCGAGIAGTEVAAARDQFLAAPHPFASLVVKSDGYTACLGAHGGEDGAVIAVGTGTIGFQVESGREGRVGGWGFPHGDEGGGALLGLEAARRTLQWLDGREPVDPLLEAVYARFEGVQGRLVSWANAAGETEFGELAPLVVEHAKNETPLALSIVRAAAAELDRVGLALANKSQRPLLCCMLGGLGTFYEPFLGKALRTRLKPARYDSVQGALIMARAALTVRDKR
jgi:glucosamine kinase